MRIVPTIFTQTLNIMNYKDIKTKAEAATTLEQLYDVMIEVNEEIQAEHVYLSDNKGQIDGAEESQTKGNIAILNTIKNYTFDKIEQTKKQSDKTQRRLYNIKVLLKAALSDDSYKQIVDMAHNLNTQECRDSGEKTRSIITNGI